MRFIGAGARPGQPQNPFGCGLHGPQSPHRVRFLGVPLFIWLVLAKQEYGAAALVLALMGSTDCGGRLTSPAASTRCPTSAESWTRSRTGWP